MSEPALYTDAWFMEQALVEARHAGQMGEVPVGAVIVSGNRVIGRGHNLTETLKDVTAHAEMQAITSAAAFLGGKYLKGCRMYVTLEPCLMCAGAMYWSQLAGLIYGASDTRQGFSRAGVAVLHPKTVSHAGLLGDESAELLRQFFEAKRK